MIVIETCSCQTENVLVDRRNAVFVEEGQDIGFKKLLCELSEHRHEHDNDHVFDHEHGGFLIAEAACDALARM